MHSAYVVHCKGKSTKESDLNLANEWEWLLSKKEIFLQNSLKKVVRIAPSQPQRKYGPKLS